MGEPTPTLDVADQRAESSSGQNHDEERPENDAPSRLKRKRDKAPPEEIEISLSQPEPLSRKNLRKAKKAKNPEELNGDSSSPGKTAPDGEDGPANGSLKSTPAERSQHGIWIGNLPWAASKSEIRSFLTEKAKLSEGDITRMHLPAPTEGPARHGKSKAHNKGFAYVDLISAEVVEQAVKMSETLMQGRRLLIKNAKSFVGRPEKKNEEAGASAPGTGKSSGASKRIFVGNLGFDIVEDEIVKHFSKCGEVSNVHVATFEDSGKCKGYAWVTFENLDAASSAVRGWIILPPKETESEVENDDEAADGGDIGTDVDVDADAESKGNADSKPVERPKKGRKYFVNRLHGRAIRCEFAEDATLRYKKRFGKPAAASRQDTS